MLRYPQSMDIRRITVGLVESSRGTELGEEPALSSGVIDVMLCISGIESIARFGPRVHAKPYCALSRTSSLLSEHNIAAP